MAGDVKIELGAEEVAPPLTGFKLYLASVMISIGFFLALLDMTVANVAVPHIAGGLSVSSTQGTWVLTGYVVAEAICMPLTGWLARRLGAKRAYVWALFGFMLSSALCGMATTLPMLVAFRVIQGICSAPLLPLCQALLLRIFPREKASTAIAISAMTSILAPVLGPIVGGWITEDYSWRWIFYLNIPFVLISIPFVMRMLEPYETPRARQRIDFVGLVLLILWVGAFQLMLDLGREHDWFDSTLITGLAITAAVGFAAFIIWELTEEHPIVDLHMLRYRPFWTSVVCMTIGYASLMTSSVMIPLWAQTTLGYSAIDAGWLLAPMSLASLIVIPFAGRMVNRIDPRILICFGLLWMGAVCFARADMTPDLALWQVAFPNFLQGFSNSMFMLGLTVIALGAVKPSEVAAAGGLIAFIRTMGTAVGISGGTTLWEEGGKTARAELSGLLNGGQGMMDEMVARGLSAPEARALLEAMVDSQSRTIAYNHVFTTIALLSCLAALLVWIIPRPGARRL